MVYNNRPEPPFDYRQNDILSLVMRTVENSTSMADQRLTRVEGELGNLKVQVEALKVKIGFFIFMGCTLATAISSSIAGFVIPKILG